MQLAVISDIHGNSIALDAVLQDLERQEITDVVCLGDVAQGGTEPAQVVERLKKIGCPVIMGNADYWVLTGETGHGSKESISEDQERVRQWTRDELGESGLAFVEAFKPTYSVDLNGSSILCFHGSPSSFNDVILPESDEADVERVLAGHAADFLTGGHTHLQWTRQVGAGRFFNPGSVGLAYNRHMDRDTFYVYPFADYAVLHSSDGAVRLEFRHVPFDVEALERAAAASGHPFAERSAASFRPRKQ